MEKTSFSCWLKKNDLAILLFICIFLNGFQAGGSQAFLPEIGTELNVELSKLGSLPALQWGAVIVAPLLTGYFPDKLGKKPFFLASLGVFLLAALLIIFSSGLTMYLIGIFLIGLGLSSYQFLAFAVLADDYPLTSDKKMGPATAMYSVGAVLAALLADLMNANSVSWRSLYIIIASIAFVLLVLFSFISFAKREEKKKEDTAEEEAKNNLPSHFNILGILLLCFIVAIYCGVESGFAYFLKPLIRDQLGGEHSEWAIALFWLGMIPSRFIYPLFPKAKKIVLLLSIALVVGFGSALLGVKSYQWAFVLAFLIGFACGSIYPLSLSYSVDFSGGKTALATALVTLSTGVGGAGVTSAFSLIEANSNIYMSMIFLVILTSVNFVLAFVLMYLSLRQKKKEETVIIK